MLIRIGITYLAAKGILANGGENILDFPGRTAGVPDHKVAHLKHRLLHSDTDIYTNYTVEINTHITKYVDARLVQMLDSCAIKFIRIHSILRS